jgi:cold shock protein
MARPTFSNPRPDGPRLEGIVRRLVRDKGFGFISANTGQDYFFHRDAWCGAEDFDALKEGVQVSFVATTGPKGPRAEAVQPM